MKAKVNPIPTSFSHYYDSWTGYGGLAWDSSCLLRRHNSCSNFCVSFIAEIRLYLGPK